MCMNKQSVIVCVCVCVCVLLTLTCRGCTERHRQCRNWSIHIPGNDQSLIPHSWYHIHDDIGTGPRQVVLSVNEVSLVSEQDSDGVWPLVGVGVGYLPL